VTALADILAPLCNGERDERSGIVEHQFAHEFVGALPNAENVEKPARLEFGDCFRADHAAIRDDADPADGKALAQPVDDGDKAARIGGVAGPHLCANRPAVAIEHHREDHLIEIRR
jgi:hypothetical protein